MIRVLQKADIERVVDIWLDTNLKAHYFIPGQYWKNNIDLVKEMLPQAEVYVYENDCQIEGFMGLNDEYMEGIFVRDEMQSQGIGKLLFSFTFSCNVFDNLGISTLPTKIFHAAIPLHSPFPQ